MRLPLLALLLAAVLLLWMQRPERTPPGAPVAAAPQLVLEEVRMARYRPDGRLAFVLEGRRYQRWSDPRLAELEAPRLQLWRAGQVRWVVSGRRARLWGEDERLEVTGQVQARHLAASGETRLQAPRMTLWLARRYLEGEGPVHLEAPWGEVRAGALRAWLDRDRVRLEGGVHSRYREAWNG